jgi:hypothetical protein
VPKVRAESRLPTADDLIARSNNIGSGEVTFIDSLKKFIKQNLDNSIQVLSSSNSYVVEESIIDYRFHSL